MKFSKTQKNPEVFSCGKRKSAIAKIVLYKGNGQIFVNFKKIHDYFKNHKLLLKEAVSSIIFVKCQNDYNLNIFVEGGGIVAQASAIKLAISKSFAQINHIYSKALAKHMYLKTDSRVKERRKYGLKKARKASQYSKR